MSLFTLSPAATDLAAGLTVTRRDSVHRNGRRLLSAVPESAAAGAVTVPRVRMAQAGREWPAVDYFGMAGQWRQPTRALERGRPDPATAGRGATRSWGAVRRRRPPPGRRRPAAAGRGSQRRGRRTCRVPTPTAPRCCLSEAGTLWLCPGRSCQATPSATLKGASVTARTDSTVSPSATCSRVRPSVVSTSKTA